MQYVAEHFTAEEAAALRPYFTNLDRPVFALVNLPEVVKGALFAALLAQLPRACAACSSTSSSATSTSPATSPSTRRVGLARAEELYNRVFLEYGDDSVAQLGGVHLACEQASNLLTKVLEWGRLMAYLEQSTRYIPYTTRARRPVPVLPARRRCSSRRSGMRYIADLDAAFDDYASCLPTLLDWARGPLPEASRRLRLRLPAVDQGEGLRRGARHPARGDASRTSGSTAPARRSRRCCCACAPTRSPRRAPTRR